MKLLVLTSRFPYPLEKGDKLRLYHQLRILSRHFELVLVSIVDRPILERDKAYIEEITNQIYLVPISKLDRTLSLSGALIGEAPFRNKYFYSRQAKKRINEIISKEQPDHIYCQLIRMADYVKDSPVPKTLDFMDAFSTGLLKRYQSEKGLRRFFYRKEYHRTKKYEAAIVKQFNNFTIISDQDKSKMPDAEITVVRNGIDLDYFKPIAQKPSYDLLFVGNLGYYPNVQAAKYLVRKILPHLDQQTSLLLAGARPTKEVKALQGTLVKLLPWLDDIRDAYSQASIFVAPLFAGIGQQNKILESMAMGIPCVTSSEVNNAIGATPGKEILIADNPMEFTSQIERLKESDLYNSIRTEAINFVQKNYNWESATQPLIELIKATS